MNLPSKGRAIYPCRAGAVGDILITTPLGNLPSTIPQLRYGSRHGRLDIALDLNVTAGLEAIGQFKKVYGTRRQYIQTFVAGRHARDYLKAALRK